MERKADSEVTRTEQTRTGRMYRPFVDILEQRDELLLLADMPGTSSEDIDINFEKGELTIHGRVRPRQPEGTDYLLSEYGTGDYYRTFQVSESIDVERISAEYTAGVLTLHLPKTDAVKPRKISVTAK
jgi:HSP20 family protein